MSKNITIIWFRKDLRLQDNLALCAGLERGSVIPVFIWSKEEEKRDAASSWWLHHSLYELDKSLQMRGSKLIIRKGESLQLLSEIIQETGADALYYNERYEPSIRIRDEHIKQAIKQQNIEIKTFHSNLLFPPQSILNKQRQPYKVFTPFWKECMSVPVAYPRTSPAQIPSPSSSIVGLKVDELGLLPSVFWYKKFSNYWQPGEAGAMTQWRIFIEEGLYQYQRNRDYPGAGSVSRLSPHLTWGEISPKWIWHHLIEWETDSQEEVYAFLRQMVWREFAYHQMVFYPEMVNQPLRKEFLHFPWEFNEQEYSAWKAGKTGYPLIDAGMRELWETGWMHNRVRMAAASFLVKHLMVPWQIGASWFEDTLLDWDLANNTMGWQWVTGCGFDASPYFRIFNPVIQAKKFDEAGDYIRQWIPELTNLPNQYIHNPWKAPVEILRQAEVHLGLTYPFPIVEHPLARERALEAYEHIKNH
jgi:deoxyribodipyrimidine photo-lyase